MIKYIYIYEDDNMESYEDNITIAYYFETYVEAFQMAQQKIWEYSLPEYNYIMKHRHTIIRLELGTQHREEISAYYDGSWSHDKYEPILSYKDKIREWCLEDPCILRDSNLYEVELYLNYKNNLFVEEMQAYHKFCVRTKSLWLFTQALQAHKSGNLELRNKLEKEIIGLGLSLQEVAHLYTTEV